MGLSSLPSAAEGVLPVLVLLMVLLNSLLKSAIQITTTTWSWASSTATGNQLVVVVDEITTSATGSGDAAGRRRVSITHFKCPQSACVDQSSVAGGGCRAEDECSVCLSEYEDGEEVSELGCNHLFHRSCLDKWFHNHHSTCPLCRSIL